MADLVWDGSTITWDGETVNWTPSPGAGDISGIGSLEGAGEHPALTVPTGLTVTPTSSTTIELSWDASIGAPDFYEFERQKWNGSAWVDDGEVSYIFATSYSDTGLTPESQYRYRVQAVGP